MKNSTATCTVLLAVLLTAPALFAATDEPTPPHPAQLVLGNHGQIYALHLGTREALLPGALTGPADSSILALEITAPGGEKSWQMVPGTGGTTPEAAPLLIHEKAADSLVVLWRIQSAQGGWQLRLVTFDGSAWSDVHNIVPDAAGVEALSLPRVALTRDVHEFTLTDSERFTAHRAILHLAWQAVRGGRPSIEYAPLILVDGQYVGWHDTYTLNDLFDDGSGNATAVLAAGWRMAFDLAVASDEQSVVVTFPDAARGSLTTLEIGVLPLELVFLSDQIRDRILELASAFNPDDLLSFSGEIRGHIIGVGLHSNLQPDVVNYLADEVGQRILDEGDTYTQSTIEDLANDVRDFAIDLTSHLLGQPAGDDSTAPTSSGSQIIEIDLGDFLDGDEEAERPAHILDLRVTFDHPLPAAATGPATIYTSTDGRNAAVAWESVPGTLHFVESDGDGWTETRTLRLDAELSLAAAYELVQQRMR